jgi:EAL domain-containing protein (putative c-di-GMP-specific phosphodiesterase class I)
MPIQYFLPLHVTPPRRMLAVMGPASAEPFDPVVRDWPRKIRDALARDRFVLHGQRIVNVASGATMRHELFLRMVDDDRLIPAAEFVVAAEEHGSIREIDHWVVGKAIDLAAAGKPVHLNLSLRSTDGELLDLIAARMAEAGADPRDVVFELSESQLVESGEESGEFVRGMSDLGCGLALDHFVQGGKDYILLRRFALNYIKLGPAFIRDLAGDSAQQEVMSSVVQKAHGFGQRIIAQGVEDLVTLQVLDALGVDEAQGHVLGAPEPIESLIAATA